MLIQRQKSLGYSIIEVLIASLLVVVIAAGTYRFLESQNATHMAAMGKSVKKDLAQKTLDRFQADLMEVDSNWQKLGLATIYPHPGYRLGENYYVENVFYDQGLSDAVTFLRRHPDKTKIYQVEQSLQDPDPSSGGEYIALYGSWIEVSLNDASAFDMEIGDWVMLYEPGKNALGVVLDIDTSTSPNRIKLQYPSTDVMIEFSTNQYNYGSGFITKPGVVPGSYDYNTFFTGVTNDDLIQFAKNKTHMQVVRPVTYELDWMTSDGQPNDVNNNYILDEGGQKQSVIVRTEYEANQKVREYLGRVSTLGFSYDILLGQTWTGNENLTGYTDG